MGYQPPFFPAQEVDIAVPSVQSHLCLSRKLWRDVRSTLLRSADHNQLIADQHWSQAPNYLPGQRVWLSSKDLPPKTVSKKLTPPYVGPFLIDYHKPYISQTKVNFSYECSSQIPCFSVEACYHQPSLWLPRLQLRHRPAWSMTTRPPLSGGCWTCADGTGPILSICDISLIRDFHKEQPDRCSGSPGGTHWGEGTVTAVAIPSRCSDPSPPLGQGGHLFPPALHLMNLQTCLQSLVIISALLEPWLFSQSSPDCCFTLNMLLNLRLYDYTLLLNPRLYNYPLVAELSPVWLPPCRWNPCLSTSCWFPTALVLSEINPWFNSTSMVCVWVPPVWS